MCDQGDEWQARLDTHFRGLKGRRGDGRVVFGLEHGLTAAELMEMDSIVAATIASPKERARHWLPLVVHASEVAYAYSGDEYWQSFERKTEGWDHAWRPEIRAAFVRFAHEYAGPSPHGRWADWFRIICWPIANAILPTDLQRHLARALFDARLGLAPRLGNIQDLGQFVADNCDQGSERFQQLREQPLLLGQIALALLRPQENPDALILDSTLRRIVADLESERSARAAIQGARDQLARPAIKFAGTRFGIERPARDLEAQVEGLARFTSPEIFLRAAEGERIWSVRLSLPNLTPLADLSPTVRQALATARSWAPAADAPIVASRLLFDDQDLPISRWPASNTPLVRFQGLAAGLESVLMRSWAAPDLPMLFRVRSDLTARRVVSRVVRPGQIYLLAAAAEVPSLRALEVEARCSGVHIYRLEIPVKLEPNVTKGLRGIGLIPAQSSRIWPAGAIPVMWDGESVVEWLTSDKPLLGVFVDHELREFAVEISDHGRATAHDVPAGTTLFVALPELPIGIHEVVVREVAESGSAPPRALSVGIRAPRGASGLGGPLRLWVEPFSRKLDDLWNGTTAVCVAGPTGSVELGLTLAARPVGAPLASASIHAEVPLSASQWRGLFADHITERSDFEAAYDDARWGRVTVDAHRRGTYAIEFERSLPPLRWRLGDGSAAWMLTLHDDGESSVPAVVTLLPFAVPNAPQSVVDVSPLRPFPADEGGGMYVAARGTDLAALVAPPRRRVLRDLSELGYKGRLAPIGMAEPEIAAQFRILRNWSDAKLPGHPLARAWRTHVVRELHAGLIRTLCGPSWGDAEADVFRRRQPGTLARLAAGITSPSPVALQHARSIVAETREICRLPIEHRVEAFLPLMSVGNQLGGGVWQRVVGPRGSSGTTWAAEFFLRLATDPELDRWAGGSPHDGIALARAWSLPLRVARYLAMSTIVDTSGPGTFPPLFDGWTWL
jgi:hypothetical protein